MNYIVHQNWVTYFSLLTNLFIFELHVLEGTEILLDISPRQADQGTESFA